MNVQKIVLILLINTFFIPVYNLTAQEEPSIDSREIEEVKAELLQQADRQVRQESYVPEWQKDFDALRIKSNNEMARSLKLSIEQKSLQRKLDQLTFDYQKAQDKNKDLQSNIAQKQEILDEKKWKATNDQREQKLKEVLRVRQKELEQCHKDMKLLQDKIDVIRLKLKLMGVNDLSDRRLALQEERNLLEAKILGNEEKMKDLTEKINAMKSGGMKLDPQVAQLRTEIESSRKALSQLEEKQQALKGESGASLADTIEILKRQKADVQKETERVKAKVLKYRNAQKMGIENKQIKELVESISAVDAANNKFKEEMAYLNENIVILKVRIKRLEYKAESMNAIRGKSQSMAR